MGGLDFNLNGLETELFAVCVRLGDGVRLPINVYTSAVMVY